MPILHWLNKDQAVTAAQKTTYRLLKEVPALSYGESDTENLLIQGDNLEALKALIPFYAGKVKCIFIDPPYNTHSAFEHYDDNLEHSKWLSLIYPRLELLRELLAEDGSIWITIDDHEAHYLKVICDEIFGRRNFIGNVVWQKRTSPDFRSVLGDGHDSILVLAKNREKFVSIANLLPLTEKQKKEYKNPDNDPRGAWVSRDFTAQGYRPNQMYEIVTPSGAIYTPPSGSCWKNTEENYLAQAKEGRFYYGKDGKGVPRRKNYLKEAQGRQSWTWWSNDEVGHTQESKKEIIQLFGEAVFDTPKPERLIQRILHIATNPDDLVLDSFLGSGTTAAVAHKMGRRYIGIELGEHARTHCQTRLQKVVDGEQGGISKAVDWQGGGGFRFMQLGESVFDEYGSLNAEIKFPTLAAHIWFLETRTPLDSRCDTSFLGVKNGVAYYLLYNGILGDRRPQGGNVLTSAVLNSLPFIEEQEKIVIYGESCRLGASRLQQANITFKQIPYDVGML